MCGMVDFHNPTGVCGLVDVHYPTGVCGLVDFHNPTAVCGLVDVHNPTAVCDLGVLCDTLHTDGYLFINPRHTWAARGVTVVCL